MKKIILLAFFVFGALPFIKQWQLIVVSFATTASAQTNGTEDKICYYINLPSAKACGDCDCPPEEEEPEDCNGVPGGDAVKQECGCVLGNTGRPDCDFGPKDCAGVVNGTAVEQSCGCVGGTTGFALCDTGGGDTGGGGGDTGGGGGGGGGGGSNDPGPGDPTSDIPDVKKLLDKIFKDLKTILDKNQKEQLKKFLEKLWEICAGDVPLSGMAGSGQSFNFNANSPGSGIEAQFSTPSNTFTVGDLLDPGNTRDLSVKLSILAHEMEHANQAINGTLGTKNMNAEAEADLIAAMVSTGLNDDYYKAKLEYSGDELAVNQNRIDFANALDNWLNGTDRSEANYLQIINCYGEGSRPGAGYAENGLTGTPPTGGGDLFNSLSNCK